eukprot:69948-Pyramimonas_sp.AAC.1
MTPLDGSAGDSRCRRSSRSDMPSRATSLSPSVSGGTISEDTPTVSASRSLVPVGPPPCYTHGCGHQTYLSKRIGDTDSGDRQAVQPLDDE